MKKIEWLTVLLGLGIYASFGLLCFYHNLLPNLVLFILGAITLTLHGSFQHECIHGHPTKKEWFNHFFAHIPLNLFLPFGLYRHTHLIHHQTESLTHPTLDPESHYVDLKTWNKLPKLVQIILTYNQTLSGRLILGPFIYLFQLLLSPLKTSYRVYWLFHIPSAIALCYFLFIFCDMSFSTYFFYFLYPGLSLTLIRSFVEHRPAQQHQHASALVEAHPFWHFLFLGNNLHIVHHHRPNLPWYKIESEYKKNKKRYLSMNDGYFFEGYSQVITSYLLRPKDKSFQAHTPTGFTD